jgi:ornithine cyclodeaminase/alanine dehydrogenase-like protein (mu-crystallin family)
VTLVLSRAEVAQKLSLDECIAAVERAFRLQGEGRLQPPGVLGMPAPGGGFHVKAAFLPLRRSYFAAKVNGNFSGNAGMPAIQGVVYLADGSNGEPLAVMDSIEITILRTGAATAVAARRLARADARVASVCGCGNQGRVQVRALARVLPLSLVYAWDADGARARRLAAELSAELGIEVTAVDDPRAAVSRSDVCVTCTPSREPFLRAGDLRPGTFVAAVGADSPDKQELDPAILASSKVVVDVLDQCAAIGELHHALEARLMTRAQVHAELGEVVAGRKAGRTSEEEIIVFDSTGTALQDAAAAAVVYEKSLP